MNGPQHYAMAEQLLAAAEGVRDKFSDRLKGVATDPMGPVETKGWDIALAAALDAAQAHATLALVAATVQANSLDAFEVAATGASGLTEWGKAVAS